MNKEDLDKIGEGWQYKVYRKDNKVIKIPKNNLEIIKTIITDYPRLLLHPLDLYSKLKWIKEERRKSLERLKDSNLPKEILANYSFEDKRIIQSEVTPIKQILDESNISRQRRIIDDFIEFTIKCWKFGFSEKTYNFTVNHGVDEKGNIVLMDFGEITFSKERIKHDIENQVWLDKHAYNERISKELKPYFKKQMSDRLTVNKLENMFGSLKSS